MRFRNNTHLFGFSISLGEMTTPMNKDSWKMRNCTESSCNSPASFYLMVSGRGQIKRRSMSASRTEAILDIWMWSSGKGGGRWISVHLWCGTRTDSNGHKAAGHAGAERSIGRIENPRFHHYILRHLLCHSWEMIIIEVYFKEKYFNFW